MRDGFLDILKASDGYISGEEISRRFHISRSAIWKYIQALRQEGYEIEAVRHKGYRLCASPDTLTPHAIQSGLMTAVFGKNITFFEETTSTMDRAFEAAIAGAAEGSVICAEYQTQGKGRMGRAWVSPKQKGVYMSVILRPNMPPTTIAPITLLAAVAVAEALEAVCSVEARIKWPNDIFIGDKKVAGILTELRAELDRVRFVIIGIGVNVNATQKDLPAHATSLKRESKQQVSRVRVVQEILQRMETWYGSAKAGDFSVALARWKQLSCTLGKRVRFDDGAMVIEGHATDIDSYGGLVIRTDTGAMVKRLSGDVVHL